MNVSAGMKSLAVAFPQTVRTNDYWRERYPADVANAEKRTLAKIWSAPPAGDAVAAAAFDVEMAPYLSDPFRGSVERRVLAPGETALSMEARAARSALAAASMTTRDVDLMIVSSFLPDHIGTGNAVFLARELGLAAPAWNLETACSSSVVGFQTACALVQAGHYRNVLYVVSCSYTREADASDTLSWFLGDGAGAFVVSSAAPGRGLLGSKTIHTAQTCGAFLYELGPDPTGHTGVRMRAGEGTGKVLRDTAEPYLRECCEGAVRAAGVSLSEIDFFVFNTPTAWYAAFAARALGVDPSRTISTYPRFANIGPALMPANLHAAASLGHLRPDSLILLYAVGSVSTASAAVMRWDDVALGPAP